MIYYKIKNFSKEIAISTMGNLLELFTPIISAILRLLYGQGVASFEES